MSQPLNAFVHRALQQGLARPQPSNIQGEDAYWKHGRGPATFIIEVTRKEAR